MTIRPTISISSAETGALADRLNERAANRSFRLATRTAGIMEEAVIEIIESEFVNDRAPQRRKGNTTKLINSFRGKVTRESGSKYAAVLTLKPGANAKKVAALDRGYDAFQMDPGPNGLAFPGPGGDNAYGNNDFWTDRPVQHPGYTGKHFMRRARQRALRRIRSAS